MRQRLTYEIARNDGGELWTPIAERDEMFSREPHAVARSLLEGWIIDNPDQLTGGERIVVPTERHPHAHETIDPVLRVRLFRGARDDHEPEPAAVGYLGHDSRDYSGQFPVVPDDDRTPSGVRARLDDAAERARSLARSAVHEHPRRTGAVAAVSASLVAGLFALRRLRRRDHS